MEGKKLTEDEFYVHRAIEEEENVPLGALVYRIDSPAREGWMEVVNSRETSEKYSIVVREEDYIKVTADMKVSMFRREE